MASHPIFQFYAELDYFQPKIWRRFQVTSDITVARLGYVVQVLFEMTASHLMAIEVPSRKNTYSRNRGSNRRTAVVSLDDIFWRYEIPADGMEPLSDSWHDMRVADATQTKLHNAVSKPGAKLVVNYDFGDDWWVSLTLEKVFADKDLPGSELPRVLEGGGFGIVEDVGGIGGLMELVEAFKKKKGREYKRLAEWLGAEEFDIASFDIDDMNFRLKKIPRIYKQCYEDGLIPTQKSIDLIERKYR